MCHVIGDDSAWLCLEKFKKHCTNIKISYYFTSEMELATATTGEDSVEKWTLGAKYEIGPGVDFLGTVQNVKWSDEGTIAANNNKGTVIVGGIEVAF